MERSKMAAMKTYFPNRYNNNSNHMQVVTTNVVIVNNLQIFYILDLSNGKIFTMMEWLMVFVKVPL